MFFSRQAKDDRLALLPPSDHCVMSLLSIIFLLHHNKLLRSHVVYYSLLFYFLIITTTLLYITLNAFIEAIKAFSCWRSCFLPRQAAHLEIKHNPQAHDASRCLSRISRTPPPPGGTLVLQPLHFQNVVSCIRYNGRRQSSRRTFRSLPHLAKFRIQSLCLPRP